MFLLMTRRASDVHQFYGTLQGHPKQAHCQNRWAAASKQCVFDFHTETTDLCKQQGDTQLAHPAALGPFQWKPEALLCYLLSCFCFLQHL